MTDIATQLAVERLLARYVASIDEDRLEEWPGYFAERCRYQIITRENHDKKLPIGIFFADSRAMLQDRVASLRQANIYEAQRYRHLVSATLVSVVAEGVVAAQSNYQVVRITAAGAMTLFSTGRYFDRIRLDGPEPLFEEKLVVCDSRRVDTLLAIPL
jgi:3-phenylpropionate/cinnamic acid dioxygenase small subunit